MRSALVIFGMWKYHVEDDLGKMKVVAVRPSHIKAMYAKMSNDGYARSTIRYLQTMLLPAFGMAVEDDIIRKNPAVNSKYAWRLWQGGKGKRGSFHRRPGSSFCFCGKWVL